MKVQIAAIAITTNNITRANFYARQQQIAPRSCVNLTKGDIPPLRAGQGRNINAKNVIIEAVVVIRRWDAIRFRRLRRGLRQLFL